MLENSCCAAATTPYASQVRAGPGLVAVGWGANYYAEVGHPGGADVPDGVRGFPVPRRRGGSRGLTSYAVQADGTVLNLGRYADGTNESQVPVPVQGVTDAVAVTGGYFDSLAIPRDGSEPSWHAGAAPAVVEGVTGGGDRRLGPDLLRRAGRRNPDGLGATATAGSSVPARAPPPPCRSRCLAPAAVVAVSAGGYGAQALAADASVWHWGWDSVTFKPDGTGPP